MALYKGANKVAGSAGAGFTPENAGTTGQVLTKTATGYSYQDTQAITYIEGPGIDIDNNNRISADLTAGSNITIDKTYQTEESDRKGPAPSGFHVPANSEWQGLDTIMSGLGLTTGDNWRINLHMPFAGYRYYSTADLDNQGSRGYYWSSSPYGSDYPYGARSLYLDSSYVNADYSSYRADGFSVRCFKDSFEAPTSSWTVITGTLGSAGIFWNQIDGLISITSDGTTGYTIQDKNLGATTVYSYGDTLSESNCGKYYQWGNNYGFSFSGTITTSSTQVNAQDYGPGNYYSSSTFIIESEDWSSVQNDNLWGDTSDSTHTEGSNAVTVSARDQIVYITQADYDLLPSSKLTDGINYVIIEEDS